MRRKNTTGHALAVIAPRGGGDPMPQARGADVAGIVEEEHRKYRIKAGRLGGTYVARAFPKPPSKAQGVFAEAEGDTKEAALTALMEKIEARDTQRRSVRRWDETASVSVANEEEFIEALYQTSLTRPQVAMLKAHSFAREDGMTFAQLARAAGYKSSETAAKVFSKAGDLIADYLGIEIDETGAPDRENAALVLAFQANIGEDAATIWVMHPELRNAVKIAL